MFARSLFAASLIAFAAAVPASGHRATPESAPVVETAAGTISGNALESGVHSYLGIPYAAPPVRDLRWRPPVLPDTWEGVFYADRFGPQCMQPLRGVLTNQYSGAEVTSEDCLYLNVWARPGLHDAPVVVFIHGGGFFVGAGSMPLYSGEHLAEHDVVVVNFNYRLGALGFLAHPELSAESEDGASGNYGLLDQVAALEWVRDNIAGFGGDPETVTIVGQSAGSMSVLALQASPLAQGLFDRAVGMSGALIGGAGPSEMRPLSDAEADGLRIQEIWGTSSVAEMRALAADRMLALPRKPGSPRIGPVEDGYFLPRSIEDIFAEGAQADIPLIVGFTSDESFGGIGAIAGLEEYHARAEELFGKRSADFLSLYPASNDEEARAQARLADRDGTMALGMREWAKAQLKHGSAPVFSYEFTQDHRYPEGVVIEGHDVENAGAYHTAEVPFWLGTLESFNTFRPAREWRGEDRLLSQAMQASLAAFARKGSPSIPDMDWPLVTLDRPKLLRLSTEEAVMPWPSSERLDFFQQVMAANPGD